MQVKEWLILELHTMIKGSHILACQIVFILLCNLSRQGGVLKHKRDGQFQVIFAVWGLVPQSFLGILRHGLCYILLILVILITCPIVVLCMTFPSKQECFSLLKMVLF